MTEKVHLLDFHLDERRFGMGLSQVERVIRAVDVSPLPRVPDVVFGIISLAGKIVPVLDTRGRFGFARREIGVNDQFIIARTRQRTVALVVDGVGGVHEYPAEKIVATEKFLHSPGQIEGVIQLEDGLILIHDLDRFLSLDEASALEQGLTGAAKP